MSFKQFLRTTLGLIPRHRDPMMALALREKKRIAIDLQHTTEALTRHDLAAWRTAWQQALSVESPSRTRLYDIYRDAVVDLHLSGCIDQRKGMVMARTFKWIDSEGTEHPEVMPIFDREWFKEMCRHTLDSIYWGHSLIELGNIVRDAGSGAPVAYDSVTLIPRRHVIPEKGRIVRNVSDAWQSGINYRQSPYADWLIEVGSPTDLGLLLKAASQTIPKKNMLGFWDTFGEIFGMPMRVARTTSRDPKEQNRLLDMLSRAGAQLSMVLPSETEIDFVESAKNDAYNVYDRRIDRANTELSKLILGQTMTIEDGSSLSQSETHLEVLRNLIEADADMLRDVINNRLIPLMRRHGFTALEDLHFEWDYAVDYTPEQQIAYETMVADRYEVDPSYFAEKYTMPVGNRRSPQTEMAAIETLALGHSHQPSPHRQQPFFD